MSCLFYIIVVTIGSMCINVCTSMKNNIRVCPNGCLCNQGGYDNDKYNMECQQRENLYVNLTELNNDCVKCDEFNLVVSREEFKPVLSLCGLHTDCSMSLYLDTSQHDPFDFIINNFNIRCPHLLTGLFLKGSMIKSVRPNEEGKNTIDGSVYNDARPRSEMQHPREARGKHETNITTSSRAHNWKMTQLVSTGNDFSVNSVPQYLLTNLHQLKMLNLSSNHIKYIKDGTFSNAGLNSLEIIDLRNNYISIISLNLFRALPAIKRINLSQNTITHLPRMTYCSESLSTLTHVNMENNDITALPSKLFCHISKLEKIDFSHNHINQISEDVMDNVSLSNIKFIFLKQNHIVKLPIMNYDNFHLQKLSIIDLSVNRIENLEDVHISSFCQLPRISQVNLASNRVKAITVNSFLVNDTILTQNLTRKFGFLLNLDHNQIQTIDIDAFNSPVLDYIGQLNIRNNGLHRFSEGNGTNWKNPGLVPLKILLTNNKLNAIPTEFFKHFPALKEFSLKGNDISQITENTFLNLCCHNVTWVDFSYNKINFIHENAFTTELSLLQYLNLKENKLIKINAGAFKSLISLRYLDISRNKLSVLFPVSLPAYQNFNYSVILQDNYITSVDIFSFGQKSSPTNSTSRESNSSENTKCVIDLRRNNITHITNNYYNDWNESFPECHVQFDDKNLINSEQLLQSLPSETSSVTSEDMSLLTYISTKLNPKFKCSCLVYNYIRLLGSVSSTNLSLVPDMHNRTVCYTEDLTPISGAWFLDPNPTTKGVPLRCYINNCTDNVRCSCHYTVSTKETLINCSNLTLIRVPQIWLHRDDLSLNLAQNNIVHVPKQVALKRITKLNLSYNKISNISKALSLLVNMTELNLTYNLINSKTALNEILSLPNLESIYLEGNPFLCNCEGNVIKDLLLGKNRKIKDINDIKCAGPSNLTGRTIIQIKTFNCSEGERTSVGTPTFQRLVPTPQPESHYLPTLVASVALTVLALVLLAIILYKCKKYIQILLFSKFGWRFSNNYSSDEKLYDVFISHSSLDSEWVLETLLPRLENNQPPYKVTVHQRDFLPGNSILNNIANAITNSKAVILVLSNNFIESEWCKFEFREAVTEAIKMKYPQIIVVLLEKISMKTYVGEELLLYLRTHTYIDWNSSYFWPRLIMSLPEPTEQEKTSTDL